jgi:osmoprotectant transport system ATP-binding protein
MIRLENVSKIYDTPSGAITAVDNVSFEVPEGEICVLLGPSGCGKTTVLKMINRLIAPSGGRIFIDGRDTGALDPVVLRRSIGYVIQQIGLFPNKTIEENICTVPDLLGWPKPKSRERAAELLNLVALDPAIFLKRYPRELSGGQQQRVGVVRALAADPPVLLMDEPFGAIDPINRHLIQDEFLRMQATLKKTVLFVSHDLDEAVKMSNRIALFRAGRLEQCATPDAMLARPANPFVEEFVGTDRALRRLSLLKASQAMMPDPPRVVAEDTLETAVSRMEANDHTSIVMVGPRGRARGYVRIDEARARRGRVGEHQLPLPAVVQLGDDLRKTVSLMYTHGVTWLAVVDDDGFFKGYVTQRSIALHLSGA